MPDTPGFSQRNAETGRLEGLDADLARLLAQGVFGGTFRSAAERVEFVEIPFRMREQVLEDEAVDIVVAMYSKSRQSRERVDFTRPYFGTTLSIMTTAENAIAEPEELCARVLCVVGNTPAQEFVEQHRLGASVTIVTSDREMVEAIRTGKADVAVSSACVLEGFDAESPGVYARPPWSLASLPFAVGVRKGNDSLLAALDARLDELLDQGALIELARRRSQRCDPQRLALGA